MFSSEWNFALLNGQANAIIEDLVRAGHAQFHTFSGLALPLPVTPNLSQVAQVMVVVSGYPEQAGAWSYTLLNQAQELPAALSRTTMAPYFEGLAHGKVGLVVLNPHAQELRTPEDSLALYFEQLQQVYAGLRLFNNSMKIALLGYSLGGEAILRFLQENPAWIAATHGLILIDPTPPSLGKRKLLPELAALVERAKFYGLQTPEGQPGEFAEATKMRLKISPEWISCDVHGAMPNLVWPLLQLELSRIFA